MAGNGSALVRRLNPDPLGALNAPTPTQDQVNALRTAQALENIQKILLSNKKKTQVKNELNPNLYGRGRKKSRLETPDQKLVPFRTPKQRQQVPYDGPAAVTVRTHTDDLSKKAITAKQGSAAGSRVALRQLGRNVRISNLSLVPE